MSGRDAYVLMGTSGKEGLMPGDLDLATGSLEKDKGRGSKGRWTVGNPSPYSMVESWLM